MFRSAKGEVEVEDLVAKHGPMAPRLVIAVAANGNRRPSREGGEQGYRVAGWRFAQFPTIGVEELLPHFRVGLGLWPVPRQQRGARRDDGEPDVEEAVLR